MKNDPVQAALARLDTPEGREQLGKALAAKSNLVAAKAARIAGDTRQLQLAPDLAAAFERFLRGADKGCAALLAIARALVKLDYDEAGLFRRGMKHVRMEGTWGGSEDVAAELRSVCATGLANTRDPNRMRDLVELLADREWPARAGAARALAAVGSEAAALLLRFKCLTGDPEPDVLSDCLTGLLEIDGDSALSLAATLAGSRDPQTREAAILALGASRRAAAVELLEQLFDTTADRDTKKCILLALASSRTEPALRFIVDLIRAGTASVSEMAVSSMSVHSGDARLRDEIAQALAARESGS